MKQRVEVSMALLEGKNYLSSFLSRFSLSFTRIFFNCWFSIHFVLVHYTNRAIMQDCLEKYDELFSYVIYVDWWIFCEMGDRPSLPPHFFALQTERLPSLLILRAVVSNLSVYHTSTTPGLLIGSTWTNS